MYPQTDEASDVFCSNFWVVQRYRLLKPFLLPDFPPDFRIFFRIPPSDNRLYESKFCGAVRRPAPTIPGGTWRWNGSAISVEGGYRFVSLFALSGSLPFGFFIFFRYITTSNLKRKYNKTSNLYYNYTK